MNLKFWTLVALASAVGLGSFLGRSPSAVAQESPSSGAIVVAQAGAWVPIARVDLQQPVEIELINRTGVPLEYALTTNEAPPRQIPPGTTTFLSDVPIPSYILVNPTTSRVSLEYTISVNADNLVTVVITPIDASESGVSTFNIDRTGAIYAY